MSKILLALFTISLLGACEPREASTVERAGTGTAANHPMHHMRPRLPGAF